MNAFLRMMTGTETAPPVERRRFDRQSCVALAKLLIADRPPIIGTISNVSCGGCLFIPERSGVFLSAHGGRILFRDFDLKAKFIGRSPGGIRLQFAEPLTTMQIARFDRSSKIAA